MMKHFAGAPARRFVLSALGVWCGFVLPGCGGTAHPEGEGFDSPRVFLDSVSTDPAPLTASGGRARFVVGLEVIDKTYLPEKAGQPTYILVGPSGVVRNQPLTLLGRVPDLAPGQDMFRYEGDTTLPENTGAAAQEYKITISVRRVGGRAYQNTFPLLTVPGGRGDQ